MDIRAVQPTRVVPGLLEIRRFKADQRPKFARMV
jgi:hypothetical protein